MSERVQKMPWIFNCEGRFQPSHDVTPRKSHRQNVEVIDVPQGSYNPLCFSIEVVELVSYLGYLIAQRMPDYEMNKNLRDRYYIVSYDKGYDCMEDFWGKSGVNVERITILKQKEQKKSKKKDKNFARIEDIRKYVSKKDRPNEILRIFNENKTATSVNNALAKLYSDTKRGGEVYRKLRPLLKQKGKVS